MSVAILIPSGSTWESAFGRCFGNMIGRLGYYKIPHTTLNIESSILPQARSLLLNFATKYQYALCLDSDMTFPMDIIPMLMNHDKPIVCANYVTRSPCSFVCHDMDGKRMDSRNKTGMERASRIALGCALINMEYLHEIPKPWFNFVYNPQSDNFMGEDYFFSDLMLNNGVEMWVDHDFSQQVGHVKPQQLFPKDVV